MIVMFLILNSLCTQQHTPQAYFNPLIIIAMGPIDLTPNNVCNLQWHCSCPYQIKYNITSENELGRTALILFALIVLYTHQWGWPAHPPKRVRAYASMGI